MTKWQNIKNDYIVISMYSNLKFHLHMKCSHCCSSQSQCCLVISHCWYTLFHTAHIPMEMTIFSSIVLFKNKHTQIIIGLLCFWMGTVLIGTRSCLVVTCLRTVSACFCNNKQTAEHHNAMMTLRAVDYVNRKQLYSILRMFCVLKLHCNVLRLQATYKEQNKLLFWTKV